MSHTNHQSPVPCPISLRNIFIVNIPPLSALLDHCQNHVSIHAIQILPLYEIVPLPIEKGDHLIHDRNIDQIQVSCFACTTCRFPKYMGRSSQLHSSQHTLAYIPKFS